MDERKVLVGLIGAGIQRSLTPAMHEEEARHHGLRLHYQLIDLDRSGASAADLPALIASARTMGFAGLNITYPCKQAVIPLLDDLSEEARAMGAVNTVVNRGGKLVGHNTDGSGWSWGFRRALPEADLRRVVLLGAGGAGSAIAHAVLRLGATELRLVDSDAARARGCATVDGGTMAVGQAIGAFELFTGIRPDAGRMEAHLRRLLAQRSEEQ